MTQPSIEGVGHGVPRMLFANDGSNWYAILVDSDGHVKIDVVAYPGSNVLGNFPFGYYDRYGSLKSGAADGGSKTLNDDATPSGVVRVITSVALYTSAAAGTGRAYIALFDGTDALLLSQKKTMVQYESVDYHGQLILEEGNYVRGVAAGVASGAICYLAICGYDMKVA